MPRTRSQRPCAGLEYEQSAWERNTYVMGIDEAGRGCFAGPVVAAAAVLPQGHTSPLYDSKLLDDENLYRMYCQIMAECIVGVGISPAHLIDSAGIVHATSFAMLRACTSVLQQAQARGCDVTLLLVDAMPIHHPTVECIAAPKGESWSASIAAASIVAKVVRDTLMRDLMHAFPAFSFEKHHGYGTKEHSCAIELHGLSVLHRRTFCPKRQDTSAQLSLFA
jgi:ribonuclease HII